MYVFIRTDNEHVIALMMQGEPGGVFLTLIGPGCCWTVIVCLKSVGFDIAEPSSFFCSRKKPLGNFPEKISLNCDIRTV